ncbi:MAG: phosphoribosylformylglycinamidine cyclo-ligase [Bdellovibrionota bacterium]
MAALSYAGAGVNREAADQFVEKIAVLSKSTLNKKVKSSIGGYASLYEIDSKRLLAASTDGVGTKLKLAFRLGVHHTVGIDLVAMSVNDLLCVGAEPLFFLDYFATGKLLSGVAEKVLEGIVEGCRQSSCALVGGETAEMPDFYSPGEYDLGGFAVGMVQAGDVLPKKDIKPGDALIGIASSGCHSNGFSLLRKLIPEGPEGNEKAAKLLTPTKIYAHSLVPLIKKRAFKGLAHITGSGFLNIPRISDKVSYKIDLPSPEERPPIFEWVRAKASLNLLELSQTFNLGIGMVCVVPANHAEKILSQLRKARETAWIIGEVVRNQKGHGSKVFLRDRDDEVILHYS